MPIRFGSTTTEATRRRFFAMSHTGSLLGTFPLAGAPTKRLGRHRHRSEAGRRQLSLPGRHRRQRCRPPVRHGLSHRRAAIDRRSDDSRGRLHLGEFAVSQWRARRRVDVRRSTLRRHVLDHEADGDSRNLQRAQLGLRHSRPNGDADGLGKSWWTAADADGGRHLARRTLHPGPQQDIDHRISVSNAGLARASPMRCTATGIPFTLGCESQGEAIGWAADGNSFYTTSEFDELHVGADSFVCVHCAAAAVGGRLQQRSRRRRRRLHRVAGSTGVERCACRTRPRRRASSPSEDYDVWRAHFGESLVSGSASAVGGARAGELAAGLVRGCCLAICGAATPMTVTPGSRSPAAACPGACTSRSTRGGRVARAWSACRGPCRSSARVVRRQVRRACVRR